METIYFRTEDGLKIEASLYDGGPHWVILAHGRSFNKEKWNHLPEQLVENSFTALPINFRGYGRSDPGDTRYDLDIVGALRYARGKSSAVSLIGASMGAAAALRALAIYDGRIDGLLLLSPAGYPNDFSKLAGKCRKAAVFFTRNDFAFDASETVAKNLPVPTEKTIFEGSSHAQVMLMDLSIVDTLTERIVEFLKSL
jgi:pimeloyl-ACP methyl ester carboxylesterase